MAIAPSRKALTLLALLLVLSLPVCAGLFDSVSKSLGIGGSVGQALSFADGFLPGSGGPTDAILGAPANAAFGGTIKLWAEANEKSIAKLGETNDRTVAALLLGLEKVVAQFDASIAGNINNIDAVLSTSISSLDEATERNLEKLDNSLASSSLRVDTVLKKQFSLMFFAGQVLVSVFILSGFVFAANRVILSGPDMRNLGELIAKRRIPVIASVVLSAVALAATWLMPDPGGVADLETEYRGAYKTALQLGDFTGAQLSASQLTVLRPNSGEYKAWDLKAQAFRDLVRRPTVVLGDGGVSQFFPKLGQANGYIDRAKLPADSDIATVIALVAALKSRKELDYASTAIAFQHAKALMRQPQKGKDDGAPSIAYLEQIANDTQIALADLALPEEVIRFGLLPTGTDTATEAISVEAYDAFLIAYRKSTTRDKVITSSKSQSATRRDELSSFSELGETLQQKLVIRAFYRGLTAKYFSLLDAYARSVSPGATGEMIDQVRSSYCGFQTYYAEWYKRNYPKYGNSLSFVSNLLVGPFSLVARAKAFNTAANACSAISDAMIVEQADVIARWLNPVTDLKMQRAGKGALLLKSSAKILSERQNAAFLEYEKEFSKLKDVPDPKRPANAGKVLGADQGALVLTVAELSAILGVFSEVGGKYVPAVQTLRITYNTTGVVKEDDWRRATRAFLESRFGA